MEKHVLLDLEYGKKYLEDFQNRFVSVPADKASNNVLTLCKKVLPRCNTECEQWD